MSIQIKLTFKTLKLISYMTKLSRGSFNGYHDYLLNHKSIVTNNGLVNQQYKSTNILQFSRSYIFSNLNVKVFPSKVLPYTITYCLNTFYQWNLCYYTVSNNWESNTIYKTCIAYAEGN